MAAVEKDPSPAVAEGGSDYLSGASNYQSKVTNTTQQGGGEAGVPEIAESLGRMKVTDESSDERSGRGFERDLPTRSHESGPKNESRCGKGFLAGFGGESGAGVGKDFPVKSHEIGLKKESGIGKESSTRFGGDSGVGLGEDFPARSHELGLKTDSGIGKDSAKESHGYGEESGPGLEKNLPARSDDVKVETGLRRDLPTRTHDQFSPELSHPKERDDFDSKAEETKR